MARLQDPKTDSIDFHPPNSHPILQDTTLFLWALSVFTNMKRTTRSTRTAKEDVKMQKKKKKRKRKH